MGHAGKMMRLTAMLALSLTLLAGLAACGQQEAPSSTSIEASSNIETSTSIEASSSIESSSSGQPQAALYGAPWVTSIFTGNIPDSAPRAEDDLYLSYSYDYIAAHQDGNAASVMTDAQSELQTAVTAIMQDTSTTNPELEQLRIFYEQAHDLDAVAAAGVEELKPYLRAVVDSKSLEELEEVLLAEDFPFSPWIDTAISASSMKANMSIAIMPKMLFTDDLGDTSIYQDSGDEVAVGTREVAKTQRLVPVETSLILIGAAEEQTDAVELAEKCFELEKSYGKESASDAESFDAEYGEQTQQIKLYSIDELKEACPNFPIEETLAKFSKEFGDGIIVMYPAWLTAFNEIWTEDNFELIRGMTGAKILAECRPFIDPSLYAYARAQLGIPDPTADAFAWAACDKISTFSQLLAKTYVEQTLPESAVDDLSKLANDLIDTYIDLVDNTPWLTSESKEAIIEKIDNIALNILYPEGGYFDYSALELTPTDQGGTLFGNYLALKKYNDRLKAELIGQPARANAVWLHLEPTVPNCAYDRISNSINIFPGFVTSALYNTQMGQDELLGGIGFIVGHEISHAFDYNGSQMNAYGEPTPVFSAEDAPKFVEICRKLADYYSTIEVEPGIKVDGNTKITEATADVCGMQVVLERAKAVEGTDLKKLLAHLTQTRSAVYPLYYKGSLLSDVHPLANLRVNVSAQMCEGFYEAFQVAEGDTMYLEPANRITLWGESSQL